MYELLLKRACTVEEIILELVIARFTCVEHEESVIISGPDHSHFLIISALFEEKSGDIVIPPVRPSGRPFRRQSVRPSVMSHHCS